MELIKEIGGYTSAVMSVLALIALLVKPVRERIFKIDVERDGAKALLRDRIVEIYYKHIDDKKLEQYEYENLSLLYEAYKSLKGNSFIDKIYSEMRDTWGISER